MYRHAQNNFKIWHLFLLFLIIGIPAIVGWILNIMEIITLINDPVTNMFIFRCVGVIVIPLGAILGYV